MRYIAGITGKYGFMLEIVYITVYFTEANRSRNNWRFEDYLQLIWPVK